MMLGGYSESQTMIRLFEQNMSMNFEAKKLEQEVLKEQINELKSLALHKKHLQKVKQFQNISQHIISIQNQYQKSQYQFQVEEKHDLQNLKKLKFQNENFKQKLHQQQARLNDQLFKKSLNLNFIDSMEEKYKELAQQQQQIKYKQKLYKNRQKSILCSISQQSKNNQNILKKNEKVLKQLKFTQFQIEQQRSLIFDNLKQKESQKQKKFCNILQKIKGTHQKTIQLIKQQKQLIENKVTEKIVIQQNLIQKMNRFLKTLESLSQKKDHINKVIQNQRFKENILQKKVTNKSLQLQDLQQILHSKKLKPQIIVLGQGKQAYINQFELRQQIQNYRIQKQQKRQALNLMIHKIQLLKGARKNFSQMIRSYKIQDQTILKKVLSNSKIDYKIKNLESSDCKTYQRKNEKKSQIHNFIRSDNQSLKENDQIILLDNQNICLKTGSTAFSSSNNSNEKCRQLIQQAPNQQLIKLRKRLEQRFIMSSMNKRKQFE